MAEQRDQRDVLRKKDNVTEGAHGLQQWGDEATPDGEGTGAGGTAQRQARITRDQTEGERTEE